MTAFINGCTVLFILWILELIGETQIDSAPKPCELPCWVFRLKSEQKSFNFITFNAFWQHEQQRLNRVEKFHFSTVGFNCINLCLHHSQVSLAIGIRQVIIYML